MCPAIAEACDLIFSMLMEQLLFAEAVSAEAKSESYHLTGSAKVRKFPSIMNMPNKLTLSRIILSPIFMSFFLIENVYSRVLGLLLYLLAALTDIADGHYARKYGIVTGFGKFMDPLADKILVSTAFIALVSLGYARAWMVMLIIAREFYVTGIRSLAAYKGAVLSPSMLAKVKTVLQMTAITFVLLVVTLETVLSNVETPFRAILNFNHQLAYDILIGLATLLTVYTGFDYTVKYYSMLKNILR